MVVYQQQYQLHIGEFCDISKLNIEEVKCTVAYRRIGGKEPQKLHIGEMGYFELHIDERGTQNSTISELILLSNLELYTQWGSRACELRSLARESSARSKY